MFNKQLRTCYEYFKLVQFNKSPVRVLKAIHIQLNNFCNLNCKWCSFVNPKNKEVISKELLINLLNEIMGNKKFKIKEINLWNAGEPLLHPDFVGIMNIISAYKKKYSKFPKIKILTNAILLNENISKNIIEIGAIDYIGFSIDGGSKEEYQKIRIGGDFDIAKKNIETFLKLNQGKVETMINCVIPVDKPLDIEWMSEDFKELFKSVDFYKLNHPGNRGDISIKYPPGFKFLKTNKRICLALLQGLVVVQNGDVLFCCDDFNAEYALDNLNNKSLYEICNSDSRKELIRTFFRGKKNQIPLCKICNRFAAPYKIYDNRKV